MNKKRTKTPYCVRNWSEYNNALVQRGNLTIWVDQDAIDGWRNQEQTGRPVAPGSTPTQPSPAR